MRFGRPQSHLGGRRESKLKWAQTPPRAARTRDVRDSQGRSVGDVELTARLSASIDEKEWSAVERGGVWWG